MKTAEVTFTVSIPRDYELEQYRKRGISGVRSAIVNEAAKALAEYTQKKVDHDRARDIMKDGELNELELDNGVTISWDCEMKTKAP